MAVVTIDNIRNICLLGHGGSGKTSTAEAMLYLTKNTDRLGTPTAGNTVGDFDPEEIKRGFSISMAVSNLMWKGRKINILDTPGFFDFVGEVVAALRVAGSAVICVDGKSGVQVGTELAWERAEQGRVPRAFFVNKSDDPEANYDRVLEELREKFGNTVCPVVVPDKSQAGAFINLVDLKRYVYDAKGNHTVSDIDASNVEEYRNELIEAIATVDETLMEKFFAEEPISTDEIISALHLGIAEGSITPVCSGSSTKLWGIDALLDVIADSFPNPVTRKAERAIVDGEEKPIEINPDGDVALYVFKTSSDQFGRTTFFKVMNGTLTNSATLKNNNTGAVEKMSHIYTVMGKKQTEVDSLCCGDIGVVTKLGNTNTGDTLSVSGEVEYAPTVYPEPFYTMAVVSGVKGEEDKIAQGINKMLDEDKTLKFVNDPETKQLLLSGMGDMQLAVVTSKLKSRNGVTITLATPKIAYRETIKKKVSVEGKHKKQSGGHGQYGHVKITFGPGEADGLTFTTSVVGGSVPKNYFPAVEKGLQEAMQKGVLAGYPVVNLAADLFDGSYHDVDSNELSFKMAASLAYKAGLPNAAPVILEPIGLLKVTIPDGMVGDIMGDINSTRRGSVLGMSATADKRGYTTIEAEVPKGEMVDYTISLRAMTQGRGSYTFEFVRYDEVPGMISQKIIAEAKANAANED